MNMYLHELKSMRKSTAIWTLSLIAFAALYLSVYPSIVQDAEDFRQLLANYPEPVRAALGISLDDIASVLGYYSMVLSFVTLCGAVQAMNLGISVTSKETRDKTADFLLVKPVSRPAVISAKLLASITMIIITDVIYYGAVSLLVSIVKSSDFSTKLFFMLNLTLFFIQLIFLSIGMVVPVFFTRLRSVLPVSLGTVLGLYIAGALIATGKNGAERFISPFRYFDANNIIRNAGFEFPFIIAGAAIAVISITVSFIIYQKKDIYA